MTLVGEPGIGKSRLLAELGARADARGMLVLSGSASEFERDLPFWLFVDALDEYLRGLPPRTARRLGDGRRAPSLASVLPSWPAATAGTAPGRGGPALPHPSGRAPRAGGARRPPPLVLLLDDLHWADSGSVELICALLRRPPAARCCSGLALRPRQVAGRLTGALQRAAADGLVTRLELGRR